MVASYEYDAPVDLGGKQHFERQEALEVAAAAIELLKPHCERIEIAGSLRRGCREVGDVELVVVPKIVATQTDLFGAPLQSYNAEYEFVQEALRAGWMEKRRKRDWTTMCGDRFQGLVYRGRPLDIFSIFPPAEWGIQFLIRTGPWAFSKRVMTPTSWGGHMPFGMCVSGGALWDRKAKVPTPEEIDVFNAIGLPFIKPEDRL